MTTSLVELDNFIKYISRVESIINEFSESNLEEDISRSECDEDLSNASDLVNVLKYIK
jgi:hypothetical protein